MLKTVIIASALLAGPAASASAATFSIGKSAAAGCYEAVAAGRSDSQAIAVCNQAVNDSAQSRADRIASHINRASILLKSDRSDAGAQAALKDATAALALDPDNAAALLTRGTALVRLGQDAEAIASYSKALALGVADPAQAHLARGVAHEYAGNLSAAAADFRQAAQLKPDWALAQEQASRFTNAVRSAAVSPDAAAGLGR
jgi:tetratricopeptide (TPR) repeat protein